MTPIRVVQWTTGNIGRRSLHAILGRDDLELVGVYAHGADKVGRDAAELCGWPEPTGIRATSDIGELLALRPDACCYNPLWPSIDDLVALLEAGVNVCASAAWITGGKQSDDDLVIVVVNLDPHGARETMVHLDLSQLGLDWHDSLAVHDELTGQDWHWGQHNYVRLDPGTEPAHLLSVRRTA